MYDLHHITRSVLHQIGEEHRIAGHNQEASIAHGPSIRPPVSSIIVRMQPIRGRDGGRVDRQGRDRDGGRGCSRDGWRGYGRDGDGGHGTPEPTLPPLSPTPIFAPDTSICPHTYSSPNTCIRPHTYPSLATFIPP